MRRTRQLRWLARCKLLQVPHDRTRLSHASSWSHCSARRPGTHECGATRRRPRPALAQQPSAHLSTAEAKEKSLPPFVGRFTTPLDNAHRASNRSRPTQPRRASTKKAALQHHFSDAVAATVQRCSPSSREQQDSPSRSRRARPSRATRGTSFPSVVKCEPRKRKTAACSARCDEVIH